MDPVFTLQWSEYVLAEQLQRAMPKSEGFSVWVPLSRQEKDVDLAITHRQPGGSCTTRTIQIKASRSYLTDEPKRKGVERHRFHSWFNRFNIGDGADFFLLFAMYPPDLAQTRRVSSGWYRDMTLLLAKDEMIEFLDNCKTKQGKVDRMFGFGFDDDKRIVQIRGDELRLQPDFTSFLLRNSVDRLRESLGAPPPKKAAKARLPSASRRVA